MTTQVIKEFAMQITTEAALKNVLDVFKFRSDNIPEEAGFIMASPNYCGHLFFKDRHALLFIVSQSDLEICARLILFVAQFATPNWRNFSIAFCRDGTTEKQVTSYLQKKEAPACWTIDCSKFMGNLEELEKCLEEFRTNN